MLVQNYSYFFLYDVRSKVHDIIFVVVILVIISSHICSNYFGSATYILCFHKIIFIKQLIELWKIYH